AAGRRDATARSPRRTGRPGRARRRRPAERARRIPRCSAARGPDRSRQARPQPAPRPGRRALPSRPRSRLSRPAYRPPSRTGRDSSLGLGRASGIETGNPAPAWRLWVWTTGNIALNRTAARVSARRFASLFKRGIVYWLPLALLFATALARLVMPDFLDRLSLLAFDGFERAAPRPRADLPVRIVAIDDKSLQAVGQWPWPRSVIAELVDKLNAAGAAVITLDILFSEPDRTSPKMLIPILTRGGTSEADAEKLLAALPDPDKRLADAIAKAPVVLGYALGETKGDYPLISRAGFAFAGGAGADPLRYVDSYAEAVGDLTELQKAAKGNGFVNQHRHWDNVVRRMPLVFRLGTRPVPSIDAETLRVATGARTYVGRAAGSQTQKSFGENTGLTDIKIGNLTVPTDGAGRVWLYFAHSDPESFISASDVLAGK